MPKTVLINGGSRGIGAELVRAFGKNGYNVAFTYHRSKDAAEALARETGALAIAADSASREAVAAAVKTAEERLAPIDVLINNAAVSSVMLFTDIDDGTWQRMLDVNLSAPFYYSRAVLPHMIREKWGRIINIVSMWGETGASCEVHYSATKAGLIGMTKALAKEVGPSGITVNAVSPGLIRTDMNAAIDEESLRDIVEATPVSRIGEAEDVASAVLFLAGEDASFITGDVLRVNGGFFI